MSGCCGGSSNKDQCCGVDPYVANPSLDCGNDPASCDKQPCCQDTLDCGNNPADCDKGKDCCQN